jgi:two-component system, OmpR family, manganese sensing sensor histidine kinase
VIISLIRPPRQRFVSLGLRRRLLLAYLIAMTAIFGVSAAALYIFFARSLHQQVDERLLTLVQAAVPSLDIVKTKGRPGLDKDLPWRNLFSNQQQSLEWFDANGQILAKEGTSFPKFPLIENLSIESLSEGSPLFQTQDRTRSVTIAIYADDPDEKTLLLAGYIRASQSTQDIETILNQLRLGLVLGGIAALILISLSGIYLAQLTLEPIRQSFARLKQFAAEASHELRNPLTRISIASEVMLNHAEQFPPSDVRKLEMINTATKQMQRLVEDLLFLARTDAGAIAPEMEGAPIRLDELLRTLILYFDAIAQIKNITLEAHLLVDVSIRGDASPLNRLFSNLLDNAIKYTESGGIVTLTLTRSREFAVVAVEDTGIGIPSEYLPFVFQRFWRSEQVRTRQEEGLGLGLAIAQTIVEQHGGKISVSSQVGVGTRFQVRFPLA